MPAAVLLVDAEPANLQLLADSLRAPDLRVLFATNVDLALEAVECGRPGVLLLNITQPVVDAHRLLEGLQQLSAGRALPVLLVGNPEQVAGNGWSGQHPGIAGYIELPLQRAAIRDRVRALLPAEGAVETPRAALIRQLDAYLDSGNTRAVSCLQELVDAWAGPPPAELQRLVDQVEGYDFRRARATLLRLVELPESPPP